MAPSYFPLRWESTGDQWWYASPIDWAAANGHYDLVREFLRLDGNHLIKLTSLRRIRRLETVWDDDEQFLDVAKCRSMVARKLMCECDNKKEKNSLVRAGYGGWLLYTAASAGDLGFVRELLDKDPLLVFGEGEYGVTDILYAAARSKNCEVFRFVLDYAISPRFLVEQIEQAIPIAYTKEMMNRAVHAAARGGNLKILIELLGDCSDVLVYRDVKGSTILHAAAAKGQVEVVKYIISKFNITDSLDKDGNTALHIAARRGELSAVESLIQSSPSSIHTKNNAGETFLHMIISGFQNPSFRRLDKQIELMKQIVCSATFKVEEVINSINNEGRTALHLAVIGNIHSDLVELLMKARSIDVNIRDVNGMTPLDLLRQRPFFASSDFLTRQLISAGGIFSSDDYTARKTIASHLKMRSMGGSPGTSFEISDTEIFLYTGIENPGSGPDHDQAFHQDQVLNPDQLVGPGSTTKKRNSVSYAAQRLKRLLHWPKKKEKNPTQTTPIPLRERFSNNNKRTLAVRSNLASPTAKKKLASGLVEGVMQAMPHISSTPRRSRSNSLSKSSISSPNSMEKVKGMFVEDHVGGMEITEVGTPPSFVHKQGLVNKSLMNQYLCFGAPGQFVKDPNQIFKPTVLSVA
ncbi:ankyrin repeat and SAM domain-containing protein 1A [Impatiens glandulifera]|uniref:ankyrin repeat and SAM domain-containing protein 1A n=1 Tax=Impatiens glandulifera TaxID=253017 RepID=UPI001FB13560|nr:ankyrin repeat and SAM domain-containing protein 1A [Impatiens glandulifera]XP_047339172.1 ankyrin repeat and SAM domain-containing protein 1A [Impatiens glandulifera]XP_047339173.1 ankyrin repeat and SAM domain-containing protein 1A [Impatiens glandulifera]